MEVHDKITFSQCVNATGLAKIAGEPVVVWGEEIVEYWDSGACRYMAVRYMSLSDYYDDIEQGGFVSESSILAIIDENGDEV